jgi:hypothetical protein
MVLLDERFEATAIYEADRAGDFRGADRARVKGPQ